jgi:MFS family permease
MSSPGSRVRSLVKHRGFVPLLAAEVISGVGSMMSALALPWFVLQTTGSPGRVSAILAAEVAAIVLLGVPSGAVASRLGVKRTLLLTQLIWAPLTALIPLLHYTDVLTFPMLLVLAFVSGTLTTPFYAAQATIIPELLGDEEGMVARGNAILQGATRATYWIGPLVAGALIAAVDAPVVLLIDAGTFVIGFVLYLFVPGAREPVEAEHIDDIFAGLRFIARTPLLRSITVAQVLSQASYQGLVLALPVLAFFRFQQDARVAGLLDGAWGAGALIGSIAAVAIVARWDPLILAPAAWAAQALPLWVLAVQAPLWLMVAMLVTSGIANGIRNPPTATISILRVPTALRTQAASASATAAMLGGLLTLAATGPALEYLGVTPTLAGIAMLSSLGAAVVMVAAKRERQLKRSNSDQRLSGHLDAAS